MRISPALASLLFLQACSSDKSGPPENCEEAKSQFFECAEAFDVASDASAFDAMWYSCVPHSEPKIIEGTWSTDFEWNAFFKDRLVTLDEAFQSDPPDMIAFKAGVEPPPTVEGRARIWAIKFVGREATCEVFPDFEPSIYVERIISQRLVEEGAGYPTYDFD